MSTRNDGICLDCGELSPVRNGSRCIDCHDDYQQETIEGLATKLAKALGLLEYAYERVPVGMRGEEKWEAAWQLIDEHKKGATP